MSTVNVDCILILQTAQQGWDIGDPSTGSYTPPLAERIPWELEPLVGRTNPTSYAYSVPAGSPRASFDALASGIVASAFYPDSTWGVAYYGSAHIEQSGDWQTIGTGTGYLYKLQRSGSPYTMSLGGIASQCEGNFILQLATS